MSTARLEHLWRSQTETHLNAVREVNQGGNTQDTFQWNEFSLTQYHRWHVITACIYGSFSQISKTNFNGLSTIWCTSSELRVMEFGFVWSVLFSFSLVHTKDNISQGGFFFHINIVKARQSQKNFLRKNCDSLTYTFISPKSKTAYNGFFLRNF